MCWITLILLLAMFSTELGSVRHASATYDEYMYIARGYTYLKTGATWLKMRHPILLDLLACAPLFLLSDVRLPPDDPAWPTRDFHIYSHAFLWEANAHQADRIVFLARLPIMMLSLLLAAGVFRWARERSGLAAGLVAMALCALDPNVLAHGRLVTPDVGQTTFIFLAALGWWRYLKRPGWGRWAIAGAALGLAQAAGFPALILYPVLAVVSTVYGWAAGRVQGTLRLLGALAGASVLSAVTVWGVYGFRWGPVESLGLSLPAPYHWEEFIDLILRLRRQDWAFFCGQVYRGGRWPFFVVALLIKTPLPTLILLGLGLLGITRRRTWGEDVALWLLPALYYGRALTSSLNIGYRHILPVLPFLFVMAGQSVYLARTRWRQVLLAVLLGWLALASATIYPFYLAYFNELAGGPLGGRRCLVISDLDWGQDLPGLSAYLREHSVEEVYLSWFGTTPPEHYSIRYRPLPAWPPMGDPQRLPFHPQYPLPGVYAISAANLEGARLADPATFAWFRTGQPQAHIGYSVFIYRVPRLLDPDAPPVNVSLSGVSLSDLPASVIKTRFRTNDLRLRWFDARRAMVFPAGHSVMVVAPATPPDPALAERFIPTTSSPEQLRTPPGGTCDVYDLEAGEGLESYLRTKIQRQIATSPVLVPDRAEVRALEAPVRFGRAASFLGYELLTARVEPGGEVALLSFWRVEQPVKVPLAIFVHLLAPDGSILGQHDGLNVPTEGWHAGDVIVQVHRFGVPATLPDGSLWLELGLYRTDTLERLPASVPEAPEAVIDRLLLTDISR